MKDIDAKLAGENDLDWSEIKDKYGIKCNSDTIRKASATIFGGKFRNDYLKSQIYSNPEEFSKEKELNKKIEELRKERIKLQTANLERNRLDRAQARQEMFYEQVGMLTQFLPLPAFHPYGSCKDADSYVLCISDIHYGASFLSENNNYSPTIAQDRFEYLVGRVIHFIKNKQISKLYVLCGGDTVQGLIHMNDLRINDSTVVKAVVEVSRLLANVLNELSAYADIEYYHVPSANHTQTRPLGSKPNELAGEDFEYVVSNYIKDLLSNNSRVNVHLADEGKQYIRLDIPSQNILAMHGHQIKNLDSSVKDLSALTRDTLDYLILGHYHSNKNAPSHEGCCHDVECLVCSSFVGSDPYSDSILKGSKASCMIYGFNELYGHDETYKIILN